MSVRTIYEMFNEYDYETVNKAISELSDTDKEAINDFYQKGDESFPPFFFYMLPRLRDRLSKYPKKIDVYVKQARENLTREAKEIFESNLNFLNLKICVNTVLTPKEIIVLMLKGKCDESIYYSNSDIANFLGIKEEEINKIIASYFTKYKKELSNLVDNCVTSMLQDRLNSRDIQDEPVNFGNKLSPLAIMVLLLKFGCVDGKVYSNREVANFFNIPVSSIVSFTENYILGQDSLKNYTDEVITAFVYDGLEMQSTK